MILRGVKPFKWYRYSYIGNNVYHYIYVINYIKKSSTMDIMTCLEYIKSPDEATCYKRIEYTGFFPYNDVIPVSPRVIPSYVKIALKEFKAELL